MVHKLLLVPYWACKRLQDLLSSSLVRNYEIPETGLPMDSGTRPRDSASTPDDGGAMGGAAQDEVDQLVLSFTDDCWLEVTDADDNILAAKLHRAGDRLILRGNAPFNIMLGNVKAAEVSLNGKTVAVTPIGSRRTLRFMVDNS